MIRVFPRKTKWTPDDDLCFFGLPPIFRPKEDLPVYISVVFTWDIPKALELKKIWSKYYSPVFIGGPAFKDPGGEFKPGIFTKEGVTITSRGCIRQCPWCFVPKREGKLRELEIQPGWIVQDNNLLACSRSHIKKVFDMLKEQNKAIRFNGGLDIRLLKSWHIDLFKTIKIHDLWFAADSDAGLRHLIKAANLLKDFPSYKKRCYVMIGFDGECLYDAEARLETVFELGFYPFCQLYQGEKRKRYPKKWRMVHREWSRPAAYKSSRK